MCPCELNRVDRAAYRCRIRPRLLSLSEFPHKKGLYALNPFHNSFGKVFWGKPSVTIVLILQYSHIIPLYKRYWHKPRLKIPGIVHSFMIFRLSHDNRIKIKTWKRMTMNEIILIHQKALLNGELVMLPYQSLLVIVQTLGRWKPIWPSAEDFV